VWYYQVTYWPVVHSIIIIFLLRLLCASGYRTPRSTSGIITCPVCPSCPCVLTTSHSTPIASWPSLRNVSCCEFDERGVGAPGTPCQWRERLLVHVWHASRPLWSPDRRLFTCVRCQHCRVVGACLYVSGGKVIPLSSGCLCCRFARRWF
jgi:hypothetical protein